MGKLNNGGHKRNKFCHKGSLGDEDDTRTSNTRIVNRKHTIPHSTMKNNRKIIQCCNNTQQGAPRTGKQTIRTRIHRTVVLASTVLYRIHKICTWNGKLQTLVTPVTLLVNYIQQCLSLKWPSRSLKVIGNSSNWQKTLWFPICATQ